MLELYPILLLQTRRIREEIRYRGQSAQDTGRRIPVGLYPSAQLELGFVLVDDLGDFPYTAPCYATSPHVTMNIRMRPQLYRQDPEICLSGFIQMRVMKGARGVGNTHPSLYLNSYNLLLYPPVIFDYVFNESKACGAYRE